MKSSILEQLLKHDNKEWNRVVASLTEGKKFFPSEAYDRSKVVDNFVKGLNRGEGEKGKASSLKLEWNHPAYLLRWFH
ncbi:MAG: hypothetical protein ABII75_09570 [Candidatus Omnitrophota bacterium]